MGRRPLEAGVLCVLALGAMISACGGEGDNGDGATASESSETVATASVARTPSPTTDPATSALFGTWRTVITEGDTVTLILRPGRYSISRGVAGAGRMNATATEVELSGSNLCDGTGRYSWSITAGELSFTSIAPDECSGRSEVLDGKTYGK